MSYNRTLSNLRREQSNLEKTFGELKIDDPLKVAIIAVPPTATGLPVWIDLEDVWIFRVYIPANYGLSYSTNNGQIAADSPLSTSSSGGSSGGGTPDAKEFQLIVSTSEEEGRLKVHMLNNTGSTKISVPKEFNDASPDNLVLETIMEPGDPMKTFDVDEAICIWRLRSKTPVKKMINNTKLYPSCTIYMYESNKRNAFKRWERGDSSSMNE